MLECDVEIDTHASDRGEAYMTTNLMQHKSSMTKRRLIIIFILCTILTVSVMTGFSKGIESDGTIYTADGERIVMWAELPSSGTPEDYDAMTSLKYASQRLYTASYFKSESVGEVVANVGMGIKYSQHVHNIRAIKGDEIFSEAISSSSLKSVADQLYFKGDNILFRPATKINGSSATFSDSVYKLEADDYYSRYGTKPNELSKYVINEETVTEIVDDNAAVKRAANADADADVPSDDGDVLYVPESLTPDEDGNYSVTVTLDAIESSKYYRNEVRTRGGADKNPVFYTVRATVVMKSDFTPVSLSLVENYDIAIPGLGAMNCSSTFTERFFDFDVDGEIPEHDFFTKHLDSGSLDVPPDTPQKSPADYLSSAFTAYLDGSKDLDLRASVSVDGLDALGLDIGAINIPELFVSVNIADLGIRAKLEDLYIEYSNDNIYITKGDVKGFLSVDAIMAAINSEPVKNLMSGLSFELPDFDLLGDDIISTVFENCELTISDGVACVRLPFSLGGIEIDASLYINDDDMSLIGISGTVKAFGLNVALSASPAACDFPTPDATYSDLSGLAGFIPAAIETIAGGPIRVNGNVTVADMTIGMDVYADLSDLAAPVLEGNITIFGQDVSVKYVEGAVYLQLGNIKAKLAISDISELLPVISKLTGADLRQSADVDALKALLPNDLGGWLDVLLALDATGSELNVSLGIFGRIDLALESADGLLSGLNVAAKLELPMLDAPLSLGLDADISRAQAKTVAIVGNYIDIKDLLPAVDSVLDLADKKAVTAGFSVTVDSLRLDGTLAADFASGLAFKITTKFDDVPLDVTFAGGTLYASVGGINLKASTDDAKNVIAALDGLIPDNIASALDAVLDLVKPQDGQDNRDKKPLDVGALLSTVVDAIEYISVSDKTLTANVAFGEISATVTAATDLSSASLGLGFGDKAISVALNGITAGADIATPDADFVSLDSFVALINPIMTLANAEGFELGLSGEIMGVKLTNGKLKVQLPTESTALALSLDANIADVNISVALVGGKLYVKVGDGIKLVAGATKDELTALVTKLKDAVPELGKLLGGMPEIKLDKTKLTVNNILGAIEKFENAKDVDGNIVGVKISVDTAALGLDIDADVLLDFDGGLNVSLDGKLFGMTVSGLSLGASITDGALTDVSVKYGETTDESGNTSYTAKLDLGVRSLAAQVIAAPTGSDKYVELDKLADLVAPIYGLVQNAMSARTISLDIAATLNNDNKPTNIAGSLTVALNAEGGLDGLGANLVIFANTPDATKLDIVYASKAVYIKFENILLSLNLASDPEKGVASDLDRLVDLLDEYLPEYITNELRKLIDSEGASVFGEVSELVGVIENLASANGAADIVNKLFDTSKGNSALKTLLEAVELVNSDGGVSVILNAMGMSFTLTPRTSGDKLTSLELSSNLTQKLKLTANVDNLEISNAPTAVKAPDDAASYVSIMDFADVVNNLVHNFTTPDENGNITFEISEFDFTYSPKPVTNEDGTQTKADEIKVSNTPNYSALKGKIKPIETKNEDGTTATTYDFALEAHIDLSIESMLDTYGKISLALYVVDGAAYVDYQEGATGYGERMSIDYASVMQILCSVMQIMDVNEDVIHSLVGEYMTDIDATFFKSMKIAGLDKIKNMIEELAGTVEGITSALDMFDKVWTNRIDAPGMTFDKLKEQWNDTTDESGKTVKGIKTELGDVLKKVIALIPEKDGEQSSSLDIPALIHRIATGVSLSKDDGNIKATVDNSLTVPDTAADSEAVVEVMQSLHDGRMLIDGFTISNLDVRTAMIAGSGNFVAGADIGDISVPDTMDKEKDTDKTNYSDLANIKRLIFDVMNTANLGEFEIGSASSDKINVKISIGKLDLVSIDIKYNAKVILIDQGEDAETRYKTAAAIDLIFKDCTALGATVVPNCTTHLYFYDDNFYIQGYRWFNDKYREKNWIGQWKDREKAAYEPVSVHYTLDEFLGLFKDIPTFLERGLFYLVPLSTDFTFMGVDLQKEIINAVVGDGSSSGSSANPTFATVFKGYNYTDGKHSVKLGLKELTGDDAFGDINLSITGQNDDDDRETGNLLNNYISALHLDTNIAGNVVQLNLDASLNNVGTTAGNEAIYSKGLGTITAANGNSYKLYKTASPATEQGYNNDDIIGDYILSGAVAWTPWETVKSWAQYQDFFTIEDGDIRS